MSFYRICSLDKVEHSDEYIEMFARMGWLDFDDLDEADVKSYKYVEIQRTVEADSAEDAVKMLLLEDKEGNLPRMTIEWVNPEENVIPITGINSYNTDLRQQMTPVWCVRRFNELCVNNSPFQAWKFFKKETGMDHPLVESTLLTGALSQ